jgi:hypothetical protein
MASMYELEKMVYWHEQQIRAMCAILGIDPEPAPTETTPEQTDPDA